MAVQTAVNVRRPYRSGSIYRDARGRWVFAKSYMANGKRVRRTVVAATRADLERKLQFIRRPRNLDASVAERRRIWSASVIERVLIVAGDEHWPPDYTARVIVAQIAVRRVRAEVAGPCAYCGDWLANTVDHVIPTAHGGTDDPSNLVSACHPCNSEKRAKLIEGAA